MVFRKYDIKMKIRFKLLIYIYIDFVLLLRNISDIKKYRYIILKMISFISIDFGI